jgi:hydroxyacylglutathione hydrolase
VEYEIFVTPGLGDNSYLVWSGHEAILVDPQRDVWRFLEVASRRGLSIKYVLETHVHNDYVSGARALEAATGATIVGPAAGGYLFPHRGLREGDEIRLGTLRVTALETPGHTPEHLAYLVHEGDQPAAIFTGGSLIVGSAGRTDLLGAAKTEELTAAQFRSLRRLAKFGDALLVLPTHGAGSFCVSTVPALDRTSTIGEERSANPALTVADEESFRRQQLAGLLAFPAYYPHMAPINRRGPAVFEALPDLAALQPADVERLSRDGTWIVDARDRVDFARGHIPGSVHVELNESFASYVGWTVPFGSPLVLVLPAESHPSEPVTQLLRIGYDRVVGYLAGGIDSWAAAGRSLGTYPVADIEDLCHASIDGTPMKVLDVRQQREWDEGHIPDKSMHLFLGDLQNRIHELPKDREYWTICASGYRASTAASLLDRAGLRVRVVARGGVLEWSAHCYPQATAV